MYSESQRRKIRDRFEQIDTANVADILDTMGYPDQGLSSDFFPYSGEKISGWAYTIAGSSQPYVGDGDPYKMEACHGIGEGEISVWSGNGEGICYFGELIALGMQEKGSVGALVDGGVRDLKWLRRHEFPVFAKYRTPVQSIGRWKVHAHQQDVSLRGATSAWVKVSPGDFILGDEDGVIIIPQDLVLKVLELAEPLTATEVKIREHLRTGASLAECLERYGHV